MPRRYTDAQRAWLAENYPNMTNKELANSFSDTFGTEVTESQMRAYGPNHNLTKSAETMARRNVKYTDEMREFLRHFIPNHSESEIIKAFDDKYGIRLNSSKVGNLKVKLGVRSGTKGGCFERGMTPWNKGMTWDDMGMSEEAKEKSRETQFKLGEISGAALEKSRDMLDIREADGYLFIKVAPRNKKKPRDNWIPLSQFEWMRANGKDFPEGHIAVFADHDNRNFDPSNIVPVPKDIYAIVSSGIHGQALPYWDKESLDVAVTHATVMHERNKIERHDRACKCCGKTFSPEYKRQRTCRKCLDKGLKANSKV